MGQLIAAGAKYKGEFEEKTKSVVKEVTGSEGEIISSSTRSIPSWEQAGGDGQWMQPTS